MNCQKVKSCFADFLTEDILPADRDALMDHMITCDACRRELEELNEAWTGLGVLVEEQPSPELRRRFYEFLDGYTVIPRAVKSRPPGRWRLLLPSLRIRPVWGKAFATILLLACGFGVGILTDRHTSRETTRLRQEVDTMRDMLAVSLLDQPSASDRLAGVAYAANTSRTPIVEKLLETLDNDSSDNVRLAAVDALYLFCDRPAVRERLPLSLARQSSPIVQAALVDLLASVKERRGLLALQELIRQGKLHPQVAEQARIALERNL